jgi:hypothetical protein
LNGYDDFRIRISPGKNGRFLADADTSTGERATGSFKLPFTESEVENLVLRVGRARRSTRARSVSEVKRAETWGGALFESVFAGDVKEVFRSARTRAEDSDHGLRLVLSLGQAPELMDLPWEFLCDDRIFLGIGTGMPVVRTVELAHTRQPAPVGDKVRILGMVSSPTGYETLDIAHEKQTIDDALAPLVSSKQAEILWLEKATLLELNRALDSGPFHIFHYVGHAGYDPDSEEGQLVLESDPGGPAETSATDIGNILFDHRSLRLVVLNACEGARTSADDPFSSVATSLLEREIPAVVAMQFEITDRAALVFADAFYGALVDRGEPVDVAVSQARKQIYAQNSNGLEWGTPVLYMRTPDARLFDFTVPRGAGAATEAPAAATTVASQPVIPPAPEVEEPAEPAPPRSAVTREPESEHREIRLDDAPGAPSIRVEEGISFFHGATLTAAAMSRDGRWVATAGADSRVTVWSSQNAALVRRWQLASVPSSVSLSPDGTFLAVGADSTCSVFRVSTGQQVALLGPHKKNSPLMRAVEFAPNGQLLATGDDSGLAVCWSADSWRSTGQISAPSSTGGITRIRFHASSQRLVFGGSLGGAWFWDLSPRRRWEIASVMHAGYVSDLAYASDGARLAVASRSGFLLLIDSLVDRLVRSESLHSPVSAVDLSPDGRWLVAGTEDLRVRAWDYSGTLRLETPAGSPLCCMRYSTNGRGLLTGASEGVARIWRVIEG